MKTQLALLCSVVTTIMGADLPYFGKWKVNLAKSDFGQTTVTFENLPGGEWQTTAFGDAGATCSMMNLPGRRGSSAAR
jgi:hypothetical protein